MITTYTSSQSNPLASQHDKIVDLSSVSLPQTNIQLYGQAQDSNHPSATFLYSWTLSKPSGSSATLSSTTIQNPILNNVDVWGNYRLFLIATNTSTGETSQSDAILAPQSSFVHIRVLSESKGLQKPAVGEKNWQNSFNALVDSVENAIGGASSMDQLTDVDTTGKAQGKYVRYDEASGKFTMQDADQVISIPPALADLSDVSASVSSATVGQVLVRGASEWEAQNLSVGGATQLNELSDCASVSSYPLSGEVLMYDSVEGWKNQSIPSPPSQNLNVGANDVILPLTVVDLVNDKLSFHGTSGEIDVTRVKSGNDLRITMSLPSSISANASTATKLATPRTIALSGSVSGSATFDGSSSISISTSSNLTQWITYSQQSTVTILAGTKDISNTNLTTAFNEGTLSKDFTDEIALHPHLIWRNNTGHTIKITYIDLVVFSGGSKDGGTSDYTFDLVTCISDEGALAQNTWTSQSDAIPALRSSNISFKNHRPLPANVDLSSKPISITNGSWFGIRTLSHPYHHGYGLAGTITAYVV